MKFLVIGLGSMGKRRIRNLLALGYHNISGYDRRKDRRDESKRKYGISVYSSAENAFSQNPDAVIISTWPDMHLKYAKMAAEKKIPFFTEVNTEPKHIEQIIKLAKKHKVAGIASMTMRFHPAVQIIKKIIDRGNLGKIYFFNYHSGENLEDWHPWERVQDYYVRDISSGGGRDQAVFELEWLLWLFGKPSQIMAKTDKLSKIPAKIFDTYQMTLSLAKSPIANVLVDVIQRPPNRILRIIFENGLAEWSWISGMVRVYNSKTKKWEEFSHGKGYKGFNVEEMYQQEISQLIRSIKEKKNHVNSFEDELMAARTVVMAEKSSRLKKTLQC